MLAHYVEAVGVLLHTWELSFSVFSFSAKEGNRHYWRKENVKMLEIRLISLCYSVYHLGKIVKMRKNVKCKKKVNVLVLQCAGLITGKPIRGTSQSNQSCTPTKI